MIPRLSKHWWPKRVKPLPKVVFGLFVLTLLGCKKEEEIVYDLFNCDEDETLIQVGADEVLSGADCDGSDVIELRSSSCLEDNLVGTATIDPCAGPIGTEHLVKVEMFSTSAHKVDRATVRLSSPGRGDDEYRMTPDSDKEGLYTISLESVGTANEVRTDTVQIKLWAEDPNGGEDS